MVQLVNALVAINQVALRRARLLLGWVTVCGQVNHLGFTCVGWRVTRMIPQYGNFRQVTNGSSEMGYD